MKQILLCATLLATTTIAHAEPIGLRIFDLDMRHHEESTRVAIWYPSGENKEEEVFAENPVFEGVWVQDNPRIKEGNYPVILFSHGLGGGIEVNAWLASMLAEKGAVVVSMDHINSSWRSMDTEEGVKHWTRAWDMSGALDALLEDDILSPHLDQNRIMAVGFSYGGWTALSLGGARADYQNLMELCSQDMEELIYCSDFYDHIVKTPPSTWDADYSDPRVTSVVAIEPGFVWGVDEAQLSQLNQNVTLIGLGEGEDRFVDSDFDKSGFANLAPFAQIVNISPATHFSAFPLCKPEGEAILEEEQDDPVCTDPYGGSRADIHENIVNIIAYDLGL